MSSTVTFGKHDGKTLVEIAFSDPAWLQWAINNKVFQDRGGQPFQSEAEEIWLKARNIRIPRECSDGSQAAYYHLGWNHKFSDLRIVADGRFEEHADLKAILDLGYVCESGCRDGVGDKLLSKAIKRIVFGENTRVSHKTLEDFFADPDNFCVPTPVQSAADRPLHHRFA
jgi:hypothetical protein